MKKNVKAKPIMSEFNSKSNEVKVKASDIFGTSIKNACGEDLLILPRHTESSLLGFIPPKDDSYVFEADKLRSIIFGLEKDIPILLWGYHGSGKSTLAEQVCAYLGIPSIRVGHSISVEESQIVGQYILKGSETVWVDGPLTTAVKHGLVYIADEYDFSLPNVLAVYQSILEPGGSLHIKEAPEGQKIIKKHPNFRFFATGNTNGSGDESSLYQGVQLQNMANYSRFGITLNVEYPKPTVEENIIYSKTGLPREEDFSKFVHNLVKWANEVRSAFMNSNLTNTVSTRELITITLLAMSRYDNTKFDAKYGIETGFSNRLPKVDKETVASLTQRIFAV